MSTKRKMDASTLGVDDLLFFAEEPQDLTTEPDAPSFGDGPGLLSLPADVLRLVFPPHLLFSLVGRFLCRRLRRTLGWCRLACEFDPAAPIGHAMASVTQQIPPHMRYTLWCLLAGHQNDHLYQWALSKGALRVSSSVMNKAMTHLLCSALVCAVAGSSRLLYGDRGFPFPMPRWVFRHFLVGGDMSLLRETLSNFAIGCDYPDMLEAVLNARCSRLTGSELSGLSICACVYNSLECLLWLELHQHKFFQKHVQQRTFAVPHSQWIHIRYWIHQLAIQLPPDFVSPEAGMPLSSNSMKTIVSAICKQVGGIDFESEQQQQCRYQPHGLTQASLSSKG
jgi:hypothetical protein